MTRSVKDDSEERENQRGGSYIVPAPLVNILIGAILSALLGIAGWMVVWSRGDAEVKTSLQAESKAQIAATADIKKSLESLTRLMMNHFDGHPQKVEKQVDDNRRRIERLENER